MRKTFIVLISLLLLCSMIGIVSAQETTEVITINGETPGIKTSDTHDELVTVSLLISQSFTVTIPDGFVFSKNNNGEYTALGTVKGQITQLDTSERLVVTISGEDYETDDSKWLLKDEVDSTQTEEYKMRLHHHVDLSGSDFVSNNAEILSIDYNNFEEESTPIHLKVVSPTPAVGSYKDTLTFTVSIKGISSNP